MTKPRRWVDDLDIPVEVTKEGESPVTKEPRSHWHRADCAVCAQRHLPGKHDQSTHGRGKGGVRRTLASAKTTEEVSSAATAEAKRITGRDIHFDMAGSDPQIAREHSEGILRGLEKFPHAELSEVRTTQFPHGQDHLAHNRLNQGAIHHYKSYNRATDIIEFNAEYAGNPTYYRNTLKYGINSGFYSRGGGTPMGTAFHEFGHTMIHHNNAERGAGREAQLAAEAKGVTVKDHISSQVSRYATTNDHELGAEAFASVMVDRSKASLLSRSIFDRIEGNYLNNNAHLPEGPL